MKKTRPAYTKREKVYAQGKQTVFLAGI